MPLVVPQREPVAMRGKPASGRCGRLSVVIGLRSRVGLGTAPLGSRVEVSAYDLTSRAGYDLTS